MKHGEPRKHYDDLGKQLHDDFQLLDKEEEEEEREKHRLDPVEKKHKKDGWDFTEKMANKHFR